MSLNENTPKKVLVPLPSSGLFDQRNSSYIVNNSNMLSRLPEAPALLSLHDLAGRFYATTLWQPSLKKLFLWNQSKDSIHPTNRVQSLFKKIKQTKTCCRIFDGIPLGIKGAFLDWQPPFLVLRSQCSFGRNLVKSFLTPEFCEVLEVKGAYEYFTPKNEASEESVVFGEAPVHSPELSPLLNPIRKNLNETKHPIYLKGFTNKELGIKMPISKFEKHFSEITDILRKETHPKKILILNLSESLKSPKIKTALFHLLLAALKNSNEEVLIYAVCYNRAIFQRIVKQAAQKTKRSLITLEELPLEWDFKDREGLCYPFCILR